GWWSGPGGTSDRSAVTHAADPHPAVLFGGGIEIEGCSIGGAHLFGLFGEDAGQRQPPARLDQGGDLRRQGDQRPGKNVGDDDVSLFLGQVLGQVDREARRVDAVTGG